ncbi:MAG: hypothetical protein CUN56_02020 [Phototrophicales bacterium]|nr:MAG: hypothetical protein CUN56_02020 [Phototrophicales bacterium]RMG71545.1 MAG: hypothetical protein D6711_15240 [Chloroflexota bacterium]
MTKRSILLIVALCFLLPVLAITAQNDDAQPTFRIGIIDTERGSIAQGARLAVREINSAGGVVGADGTRFRLELVVETPAEDQTVTNAINNLSQASLIAVIGPETTEQVLSNLPQLQDLGIPVLTPAIGDTIIASDSSRRIFRIRAAERFQGAALADILVNQLNIQNVTTVQLDSASTGGRVGFSIALGNLGAVENSFLLDGSISDMVTELVSDPPAVIVAFGAPDLAATLYVSLRESGWIGVFAYPQAEQAEFRESVPLDMLRGVLGTTTWSFASTDAISIDFLTKYTRAVGAVPDAVAAASYDAIYLIAEAIGQAGTLGDNLNAIRNRNGVQGMLNPSSTPPQEFVDSVAVIQLNTFGGVDVVARYAAGQRLPNDTPPTVANITPTPQATATPEGVVLTIQSNRQNVRTGPGLEYDILGQVQQGEQFPVIGATTDFSWVAISYRGQTGWLATYLLDVFGDRSTVPVLPIPPTPTPRPATATPTALPIPDIIVLNASPNTFTAGVTTNINVTVRNQGGGDAGPFAIATTLQPGNIFTSFNLVGLAAGAQQVVSLPVTFPTTTGNFSEVIVADLNNEVSEGAGEGNNLAYVFNYKVDRQIIVINSTTLSTSAQIDLENNFTPIFDLQYTPAGLNTINPCSGTTDCIGLLSPALNWDTAHYDAITSANGINASSIANSALTPGTTIGVLTAEGRRAVLRIDAINPGVSISFTYRVYTP